MPATPWTVSSLTLLRNHCRDCYNTAFISRERGPWEPHREGLQQMLELLMDMPRFKVGLGCKERHCGSHPWHGRACVSVKHMVGWPTLNLHDPSRPLRHFHCFSAICYSATTGAILQWL